MYADYLTDITDQLPDVIAFSKMHGLGNDFVIIDQREVEFPLTPEVVKKICDRNFGVGCDQLIILRKSDNFDCQMLIFNPDGSIARACGNACRCVGMMLDQDEISIQIHDRVVKVWKKSDGLFSVNMGVPLCKWYEIPLRSEIDPMNITFDEFGGKLGASVSVGNPHLVFFEKNADLAEVISQGEEFERHPLFPDRVNVNFAYIKDEGNIELMVWERGVGPTLACGSGASATHFIAHHKGLVGSKSNIHQRGGRLIVETADDGSIMMTGAASKVFTGKLNR